MRWKNIATVVLVVLSVGGVSLGDTIFVDASSTAGTPTGVSWELAFPTLQAALAVAATGDELWLADGTYYPDSFDDMVWDRTKSFVLPSFPLEIYGGFHGDPNGETLESGRDWVANPTILSGNIDDAGDATDNSYHVIVATDTDPDMRLDGFTIELGYADGSGGNKDVGGAMLIAGDGTNDSELRLYNCIFRNNYAEVSGGAVYNYQGTPVFVNCDFTSNEANTENGGGFYSDGGSTPAFGDAVLVNCRFDNNDAAMHGGGMYINHCSPTLTNCVFYKNAITSTTCESMDNCGGGGIYMTCDSQTNCNATTPTITNCTFYGNTVADTDINCAGLYSNRSHTPENGNGAPTITNSNFWDNASEQFSSFWS